MSSDPPEEDDDEPYRFDEGEPIWIEEVQNRRTSVKRPGGMKFAGSVVATRQMQSLLGNDAVIVDADGDKVGKIGQVYLDDESGNPEWVTTNTGLFGGSETFVPLTAADVHDNEIRVPYDKATIKDAPRMDDSEGHLSSEQESELYRYYGLEGGTTGEHDEGDGDSGCDRGQHGVVEEGRPRDHDHADEGMAVSEEQLRVGTERVETGKARLRKYVVTENVTTTVPVEREEVRLEREPIGEGEGGDIVTDGVIGDDEQELTLTEERVVVDKETVPVERVSLDTETVVDKQQVTEEVRKEQVEVDQADSVVDEAVDNDY